MDLKKVIFSVMTRGGSRGSFIFFFFKDMDKASITRASNVALSLDLYLAEDLRGLLRQKLEVCRWLKAQRRVGPHEKQFTAVFERVDLLGRLGGIRLTRAVQLG